MGKFGGVLSSKKILHNASGFNHLWNHSCFTYHKWVKHCSRVAKHGGQTEETGMKEGQWRDLTEVFSMLTQKSCFAVLQTRTLHCSLQESSTTIFQHWCKDLASEHTCNLMTISIHSCNQQPLICLGCYCNIQPTLVMVKILQGPASGLTINIKSCSHKTNCNCRVAV